ncbi:uncharacterized protein KY384_003206 [Bacidia gigantensis]|uniref:uncharacterized protein n=1 Tax=Bacidia gigantensis TaxID=2732470 RepID=UPI001D053C83|nr:uncharacterized protein KY384_003206 [Bacidia gigantensis]KAG8531576.1 hypothetical protein KY384_003206 [Bacidia gigantensis]
MTTSQHPNDLSNDSTRPSEALSTSNGAFHESKTGLAKAEVPNSKFSVPNGAIDGIEDQSEVNGTASPTVSPKPDGVVQTRKRSRSGSRISRPLPEGNHGKRRGFNDPDGRLLEKFELNDYIDRDSYHIVAMIRQNRRIEKIMEDQREERAFNLKLRKDPPELDRNNETSAANAYPVNRLASPAAIYGQGYGQYGTIPNRPPPHYDRGYILPRDVNTRPGGRKTRELRIPRRELQKHANQLEELIPIRLDIEWQKVRLRDTFTWNLHDRVVPTELFAQQLVEDFGLSLETCDGLLRQVQSNIQEQIQDYHPHPFVDDGPEDPHLPYTAYKDDEMRITVKLNITIGQHTLVDQFEWDINNSADAPELFARQMAKDLSLSGEFATAIAHDIREQCQLFTRSLYIIGHPFDGRPITDQDLQAGMMPSPMPSAFRPYQAAKEFTPYLYELNEADLERTELSLSREERRQKRSVNRRGGPALPDLKDRRRTIRTMVVSAIMPGTAETLEDSRIFKRVATASGKAKRPGYRDRDSIEGSESEESEESVPGSPAIPQHLVSGTARTRGMRGAAAAAQTAMKGALARSATPESVTLHHHETRTTGRRRDYREESVDEASLSLVVKLRISPPRFKQFMRDQKNGKLHPRGGDSPRRRSQSATPSHTTPKPGAMGPPSTPGQQHGQHQGSPPQHRDGNVLHPHAAHLGRVDAKHSPSAAHPPPPPPDWLKNSLRRLQPSYPDDQFEGLMRFTMVDRRTDQPIHSRDGKPAEQPPSEHQRTMYYPRIRCLDCPGKWYTPGPETGVTNFEVHLKNKVHRERVEERVSRERR